MSFDLTKNDISEVKDIFIKTNALMIAEHLAKNLVEQSKNRLKDIYPDLNKKQKEFFKGNASVVSRESPYGLYDINLATYDTTSKFNQKLSYGFIPIWGLQSEIGFQIKKKIKSFEGDINKTQAKVNKYENNKE